MNCEQFALLLDAYIDGELPAEEMAAFTEHARACEACGREFEAALLVKDALLHMDDEVAVPLEAQAAWRNAVRLEAKRKSAAFKNAPAADMNVRSIAARDVSGAAEIIAADGGVQVNSEFEEAAMEYTAWKKIAVVSPEEACKTLEMLAAEYNASYSLDAQGICRIELPYEYMQDFLNAASRIGVELNSEILEAETETALILIQICEK